MIDGKLRCLKKKNNDFPPCIKPLMADSLFELCPQACLLVGRRRRGGSSVGAAGARIVRRL